MDDGPNVFAAAGLDGPSQHPTNGLDRARWIDGMNYRVTVGTYGAKLLHGVNRMPPASRRDGKQVMHVNQAFCLGAVALLEKHLADRTLGPMVRDARFPRRTTTLNA